MNVLNFDNNYMASLWSSLANNRMASYKIILLVVLTCLLHRAAADCSHEGQRCDQCFQRLANYLINTSDNKYNLRRAFYPLEEASPVFMTVTYQYIDTNSSNFSNISTSNQKWYWSDGAFYFFQPLGVFQFTSLFFGNPGLRSGELNISLPAECASAPEQFMTELTQLVSTMNRSYTSSSYSCGTGKICTYICMACTLKAHKIEHIISIAHLFGSA